MAEKLERMTKELEEKDKELDEFRAASDRNAAKYTKIARFNREYKEHNQALLREKKKWTIERDAMKQQIKKSIDSACTNSETELKKINAQLSELKTKMSWKEDRNKLLSDQCDELTKENETLTEQVKAAKQAACKSEATVNRLLIDHDKLFEENQDLKAGTEEAYEECKKEYEEYKEKVKSAELRSIRERSECNDERDAAIKNLEMSTKENATLKQTLSATNDALKKQNEEMLTAKTQISLKENRNKLLSNQCKKLMKDNETLAEQIKVASTRIRVMDHGTLMKTIQDLETKVRERDAAIQTTSMENETVKQSLLAMNRAFEMQKAETMKSINQLSWKENQNRLLSDQCDKLTKGNETLAEQINVANENAIKNETTMNKLLMDHSTLFKRNQDLEVKVREAGEAHIKCRKEYAEYKENGHKLAVESAWNGLKKERDAAIKKLETTSMENATLKQKLLEKNTALKQQKESTKNAEMTLNDVRKEKDEMKNAMLKQNAQNEQVFRQSERLLAENQDLEVKVREAGPFRAENIKMHQYIREAVERESKQWVLSYHNHWFKFARIETITDSYAVVDICLKTPKFPDAGLIEDYFTVIFALADNAELTFTVGLRDSSSNLHIPNVVIIDNCTFYEMKTNEETLDMTKTDLFKVKKLLRNYSRMQNHKVFTGKSFQMIREEWTQSWGSQDCWAKNLESALKDQFNFKSTAKILNGLKPCI